MAWVWFLSVVVAAGVVLEIIRWRFGPRRVRARLAYPLAVVERALEDALVELGPARREAPNPVPWRGLGEVWVSPFEPFTERLLQVPEADLLSLGGRASEEHRRLSQAIRAWNAAAGRAEKATSLLPIILAAHRAARALAAHLEAAELERARSEANARVLVSLVGARGLEMWTN